LAARVMTSSMAAIIMMASMEAPATTSFTVVLEMIIPSLVNLIMTVSLATMVMTSCLAPVVLTSCLAALVMTKWMAALEMT
jgi:hypothetical protein